MEFDFNQYTTAQDAIDHVESLSNMTGGETYTDIALNLATNMFSGLSGRGDYKDIALVITDGKSSRG